MRCAWSGRRFGNEWIVEVMHLLYFYTARIASKDC
jgi:hypothetical protein